METQMRLFGGPQGSKESWKPKQLRTYLPDRSAPGGRSLRRRAARRTRPPLPAWWRRSAARVPATGSGSPPPLPGPRRCRCRCRSRHCLSAALCLAGASVAGAAIERRIGRQAVAKWLLAPPTSSPGGGRGGRPARQGAEPGAQRAWCTCTPQPPPTLRRTRPLAPESLGNVVPSSHLAGLHSDAAVATRGLQTLGRKST